MDMEGPEQKAPSKCSETVGGGTTMTTDADAPPSYSDVLKKQQPEGVLPDQLDQSPLMIQPAPQPGALIQLVPYMDPSALVNTNDKYRASNDFLIFSTITSICCGIFSIVTLTCTIPAVVLAVQSRTNRLRGAYRTANAYSNLALALNVTAIMAGLIGLILGVGIVLGLVFRSCELYGGLTGFCRSAN